MPDLFLRQSRYDRFSLFSAQIGILNQIVNSLAVEGAAMFLVRLALPGQRFLTRPLALDALAFGFDRGETCGFGFLFGKQALAFNLGGLAFLGRSDTVFEVLDGARMIFGGFVGVLFPLSVRARQERS